MRIGVPKEIKKNEYRVAMVPAGVEELVATGHEVVIEAGAGAGSGINDDAYRIAGAAISDRAAGVWDADLVAKVKEPLPEEYDFMRPGLVLFTFLHLAAVPGLARVLVEKRVRAIGYETVQLANGRLPLLAPMSQVAGKMAAQLGAAFLQRERGGMGILLGGVPGTKHGKIVIIGAGNVGINAAKVAYGLGAQVVIIDQDHQRLSYLDDIFDGKVVTLMSNRANIRDAVSSCAMLVGAALVPGARAPQLVTRDMLKTMPDGSVFVDVAIDQGGVGELSRPTTHAEPTFVAEGVIHYCVANIPGSVPATSTYALANVTLPYLLALAAIKEDRQILQQPALAAGANTWEGHVVHAAVAAAVDMPHTSLSQLLG